MPSDVPPIRSQKWARERRRPGLFSAIASTMLLGCSSSAAPPPPRAPISDTTPIAAQPTMTAPAEAPVPQAPPPLPNTGERLTHTEIQRIVRTHHLANMATCYEQALQRDPNTPGGAVNVSLAIDDDGRVIAARAQQPPSRPKPGAPRIMADAGVRSCVEGHFRAIRFPPTNRGIMNMIYPVTLELE